MIDIEFRFEKSGKNLNVFESKQNLITSELTEDKTLLLVVNVTAEN